MAEFDWLDFETGPGGGGWGGDVYAGGSPTFNEGSGSTLPTTWEEYQRGGYAQLVPAALASRPDLYGPGAAADYLAQGGGYPTGGGDPGGSFWGSLGNLLLGTGGAAAGALGGGTGGGGTGGGGILGPLLSSLGSLGGGAIGSNAANEAARLQSQALNRGIDLQTAQWLQQQGNLAPYLQAGQGGLAQLQQLAGRQAPSFDDPLHAVSGANYALPGTTPGWQPEAYQGPQGPNAGDYRWTPGQGPQAGDYRYTPGQTPDAAQYASGPPQLYQGAMPGTQVPTLSGQALLAQDPGAAFRQSEARKALESSAAARGGLLSGGTLQALQSRSQDLASQEYGNAWDRMMRRNTEQYGRDWGQYQQQWNQGVTGTELGLRTQQQNFAQAEAASRLREQVNQVASQQGWTQAQAEAAFREGQAQLASQQGWNQALAGQQNQFTQGLERDKWHQQQNQQYQQELYNRQVEQSKYRYGQDVSQNQTDYDRANALYRQRLGAFLLPYEQQSTLANLGGSAVGMYGQQGQSATSAISNLIGQYGTAQAGGATNQANSWMNALQNIGNAGQGYLQNNALMGALANLNR